LYQTLHFYEQKLKNRPIVKKKLVSSVIGSFRNTRPTNWALSDAYLVYMKQPVPAADQKDKNEPLWIPDLDYYIKLISRLVETLAGKSGQFPHMDWRFNEFQNASTHALHVTCIELMALPVSATTVASNLLDVCLVGHKVIPRNNIESWMNAVGLVLTAMPDSYWAVLLDKVLDVMKNSELATPGAVADPFALMDFKGTHNCMNEVQIGYMIGLTHAVWHHASVGQVSLLANFLKERVKPELRTEEQFIFVCTLLGPFLQRFYVERTRIVMDVTAKLYEFLGIIDANCEKLRFMDSICDLLYHIKYMFTGDSVKNEVEPIIRNLRPQLQLRLRFITHLNVDEVMSS
jgi:mediator of RNA polymerase II transcription subunit 23